MMNQVESRKALNRRRVLQAARQLFTSKGYAATSIDEIMGRCDLTRGVFYTYFANKSDLYSQALTETESVNTADTVMDESSWEWSLLADILDLQRLGKPAQNLPLGFFANDDAEPTPENNRAYTRALNQVLDEMMSCLNTDSYRGESVLLSIVAMIVGTEVMAKKLDDPYLHHKLRTSCVNAVAKQQYNVDSLAVNRSPDYLWDCLSVEY